MTTRHACSVLGALMLCGVWNAPAAGAPAISSRDMANTYRLYDGVTAYVVNSGGRAFTVSLDLRDINIWESGPRELLVKVYDPEGKVHVREVIPDDGVASRAYLPRFGGWDHEMWYYALCYSRGSTPMVRWGAWSDPKRLAGVPKRTFTYKIPGGPKGIYRVMIVGTRDHYVTLKLDPQMPYGVSGHALWLHGHGKMFRKSFIYVPAGTTGLHLGFAEYDVPRTRRFTLTAPDGRRLFDGAAPGGFAQASVKFDAPGKYDDKLLALEVSQGDGDFMVHVLLNNEMYGGRSGPAAVLAPTQEAARAVRGGAIYQDGQVFWHPFQVRLHEWLKGLGPADFVVRDAQGDELKVKKVPGYNMGENIKGLPTQPGYFRLQSSHVKPPLSDRIMHDYPAHRNRQALNLAIRDLHKGLLEVATGDHRAVPSWNGNMAYIFAPFGWHYWRPAWRIIQQSDAPDELKAIIREAMFLCGDRIAFAAGIERCNGNAFANIPVALRYTWAATRDPLHKKLFETYFERFATEGWGEGTGISKSGDCQEHFAHEHHYGSYVLWNWKAVMADFQDRRFIDVHRRIAELYSYTWCRDGYANPWSSRTNHSINEAAFKSLGVAWKGEVGPDFTVSVNGGDEWFAARRRRYYVLTFHGRLSPTWLNHVAGDIHGLGGGAICQLTVPGKGTVIASTPLPTAGYGGSRDVSTFARAWRRLHTHSVVGRLTDGTDLLGANSEHHDARLRGNVVTSSGEVRDCPVRVSRKYTFGPEGIDCEVRLGDTAYRGMLWGTARDSTVAEGYELIPFLPGKVHDDGRIDTQVTLFDAAGKKLGALGKTPVRAASIRIDRGGYGVKIELDRPRNVMLGARKQKDAMLIDLLEGPAAKPAGRIALSYRLRPFGN